ncbi:MAG: hypothetical protein ACI4TM_02295 [Candidatus Cryptobacteroides sp.]
MRYVIRAVKYFFYICIICTLMIAILVAIGSAEADIDTLFVGGTSSLWKIALLFAAVAAVYPKLGFIKRDASIAGSWDEIKEGVKSSIEERGYVFEKEEGEKMTFRFKGFTGKLTRMFEDRITVTPAFGGVTVEGPRKDVIRLCTWAERAFLKEEDGKEE